MRSMLKLLALLALSLLVLTGCGDDDDGTTADATTTTEAVTGAGDDTNDDPAIDNTAPSQGRIELSATLSGDTQVPGPGDDDGSGEADVTVDVNNNEVCVQYSSVDGIDNVTAAHIHRGSADESGPIVVTLAVPTPGTDDDEPTCHKDADRDVVTAIASNPSGFYVNVHTEEFPAGAIRGQLDQQS